MKYLISFPICINCEAIIEKFQKPIHEGQIVNQCPVCRFSNSIIWEVEERMDDELGADEIKEV